MEKLITGMLESFMFFLSHTPLRVSIAMRDGVPPFAPYLYDPPVYCETDFRQFFLTKRKSCNLRVCFFFLPAHTS